MRRLLLIRHTKAAAFGAGPGDEARPLSDKGKAMAQRLGQILAQAGWAPDRCLVSTALRTRQTGEGLAESFPAAKMIYDKALYLGGPGALLSAIAAHAKACETLALIGHNPGVALLADQLAEEGFDHDAAALRMNHGHFKTGRAAAFELRQQGPRLARVFDPREIMQSL